MCQIHHHLIWISLHQAQHNYLMENQVCQYNPIDVH